MQTGCNATSRHAPSNLAVYVYIESRLLASRCNEDARHTQHFVTRPLLDHLLYRVKAFRLKVQNDCTATSKDAASNFAGSTMEKGAMRMQSTLNLLGGAP
jgi:hypothetical protein